MENTAREKVASDIKVLVGDVEELVKSASSRTGERLAGLRERVGKKLLEVKDVFGKKEGALQAKAEQAVVSVKDYCRKNPWTALGIAAAAGIAMGFLLRRGRRGG
ncbi:MAG TPA: DUF883 family protein [candidate division Zixibacteria bacterium]|nr:DUF883 family protein [candidate division Zixibacteria bacterium]